MVITEHPLNQLNKQQVAQIRAEAAIAEKTGKLTDDLLKIAYQEQWFKILVPQQYGGLELNLPAEIRLIEALSWADGSLGWTVTLCCGAGWFGGFLDADLSADIFKAHDACLAGSGAPQGTAELQGDGYLINGLWNYASGALHASHFTANCIVTENGTEVLNEKGEPHVLPFLFYKGEVEVIEAWNYMGLTATGSHSFAVKNLKVAKGRSFKIDPNFAVVDTPLYKYPFRQLAEATLGVNMCGMAIHFVDLCRYAFVEKAIRKKLSATMQTELNDVLKKMMEQIN